MATPPPLGLNIVIVASTVAGVAPVALAAAIATLQAADASSRERVVGAVVAASAPASTAAGATATVRPHPSDDPPFVAAGMRALASPAAGAVGSLAEAAVAGAPTGTTAGVVGPWATAAITGAPAGTADPWVPAWPSFNPSMSGALCWSTSHAFFAAPQYGFSVLPA
jgi:hypothetical protein